MKNKKLITHDFIAIGGGSAGFNAARTAASLDRDTAIIDGAPRLGGLCILNGCMPSKSLFHTTNLLHQIRHAKPIGISTTKTTLNLKTLQRRKDALISEFADYRQQALNNGNFTLYRHNARFLDPHTLQLADGTTLRAKTILIATGSSTITPDIPGLATTPHFISDDILRLNKAPASIIVLGGGVIACELAQYLSRIGTRVTLIQRSPRILREHSPEASAVIEAAFRDENIEVITDTKLTGISTDKNGSITVRFLHNNKTTTRRAATLLNALGRTPNHSNLNLPAAGISTDPKTNRIPTNRWQQTTQPHIYAAGDITGPHDIVHLAVAQGELAARHSSKIKNLRALEKLPLLSVVFTDPSLATLGLNKQQLLDQKIPHITASYPFNDHGKSIIMSVTRGHVAIHCTPDTGKLLGAEIVGPEAHELIHILTTPLVMGATVRDLLRSPWYHPTLSEILTYPLEDLSSQLQK